MVDEETQRVTHDLKCAQRLRLRRLIEAGEPPKPRPGLLHEIAREICACCGHTRLKSFRLAYGWTLSQAVNEFHAMCKANGLKLRGLTERSWLEWESGAYPNRDYQDLLSRLFKTSPVQLGFATDYTEAEEPSGPPERVEEPAIGALLLGTGPGFKDGPDNTTEVGAPTNRRDTFKLVGAGALAPEALNGVLKEAAAEAMEFTHRVEASAVGPGTLEHLELAATQLNLAYGHTPPAELFESVRWYRKAVDRLIAGPHTLREGRELYAYAGFLSELLAWLAFELSNFTTAEAYGVDAWRQGWQAGHDELCAWVKDIQARIARAKNQPSKALAAALQGIQHAPAGHPVAVRLAAQVPLVYAHLGQREDFNAALRESMNLYERLPAQPPTRFGEDTGLTVSYAVTTYAASSCNSLDLPEQAQRHATDALDLLTAAPEKDRCLTREAEARLQLALALVPLGSPDEACDLGHQALSSDRGVVYVVRTKSLELDAALQRSYPDLPEAAEFHERCRMLARSSPSDGTP